MKHLSLEYTTPQFVKRIQIKMRITSNLDWNTRQAGIVKTIAEFKEFKRLLKATLRYGSISNSERLALEQKLWILNNSIERLTMRLGVKLKCDTPKPEYFYIPPAVRYDAVYQ